jgi:hypothetical protein
MYILEMVYENEKLVLSENILSKLVCNANKSKALVAVTKTKSKAISKLRELTNSDLIVIDKTRPNREVLLKIIDVLNIKIEKKDNLDYLKDIIEQNAAILKNINKHEPFKNVKFVHLSRIEKGIVIDKCIIENHHNLNEKDLNSLGFDFEDKRKISVANKIITDNSTKLKAAQRALASLEDFKLAEMSIYNALSKSCRLERAIHLPNDDDERLVFLKSTTLSDYANVYFVHRIN